MRSRPGGNAVPGYGDAEERDQHYVIADKTFRT